MKKRRRKDMFVDRQYISRSFHANGDEYHHQNRSLVLRLHTYRLPGHMDGESNPACPDWLDPRTTHRPKLKSLATSLTASSVTQVPDAANLGIVHCRHSKVSIPDRTFWAQFPSSSQRDKFRPPFIHHQTCRQTARLLTHLD